MSNNIEKKNPCYTESQNNNKAPPPQNVSCYFTNPGNSQINNNYDISNIIYKPTPYVNNQEPMNNIQNNENKDDLSKVQFNQIQIYPNQNILSNLNNNNNIYQPNQIIRPVPVVIQPNQNQPQMTHSSWSCPRCDIDCSFCYCYMPRNPLCDICYSGESFCCFIIMMCYLFYCFSYVLYGFFRGGRWICYSLLKIFCFFI